MKKLYFKNTPELLNIILCGSTPDFLFPICCHWAINLIESKTQKPFKPNRKWKMKMENGWNIFLKIKLGIGSSNLRNPEIVETKIANDLDLEAFLLKPRLTPPLLIHHTHIVTGNNKLLKTIF